jgi:hypothetical protein
MVLMGFSGARGTLIYEKNLKSKISCQTPFKDDVNGFFSTSVIFFMGYKQHPRKYADRPKIFNLAAVHSFLKRNHKTCKNYTC